MIPEARKLGLAPRQRILARRTPNGFLTELEAQLPASAKLATRLISGARFDLIFDYPPPNEGYHLLFDRLEHALFPNGAIWVVIPNQRAAKARGLRYNWQAIVTAALKTTLVDNKTLSFSPEEYGTRFVIRKMFREQGT